MKPYTDYAHIHSLKGEVKEVTVLEIDDTQNPTIYIVEYNGVKCKARFNPFVCMLYADDIYEKIQEESV